MPSRLVVVVELTAGERSFGGLESPSDVGRNHLEYFKSSFSCVHLDPLSMGTRTAA